jgi:hypothetical protein
MGLHALEVGGDDRHIDHAEPALDVGHHGVLARADQLAGPPLGAAQDPRRLGSELLGGADAHVSAHHPPGPAAGLSGRIYVSGRGDDAGSIGGRCAYAWRGESVATGTEAPWRAAAGSTG